VEHFVSRFAGELGREGLEVDPSAVEVLCGYGWPGNVRELQNVLKRAIVMSRSGRLTADDLPECVVTSAAAPREGADPGFFELREDRVTAFERDYLQRVLTSCHGNISQAATIARLPRGTLYRMLSRHGIDPAQFR
ncbi:MAG TPA: helix-turn-helix domain-containing protein, partial [Gemmatimonadaceae bacterium]|nr:helix-turn-helix domain-containing protein [Gemmatimonadaceae bacterium]